MAAAMNVSQARYLFLIVVTDSLAIMKKFSATCFGSKNGNFFELRAECQLHDLPSNFFSQNFPPKFMHTIQRRVVLSTCPRRLWTAQKKIK